MKRKPNFSSDINEFLYLLLKHEVRYLLVGGEAVIFYGYARLTGDIDIFFDRSVKNIEKLFVVLSEFWGGDIPGLTKQKELLKKGMVLQFGLPPNRIDLINEIDGVMFKTAWERKLADFIVRKRKKFQIYYISIDDLIMNKKTVRRNKDLDDIRFLKEVKKQLR